MVGHGEGWPFAPSPGRLGGDTVTAFEVKPIFIRAPVNWFQIPVLGRRTA